MEKEVLPSNDIGARTVLRKIVRYRAPAVKQVIFGIRLLIPSVLDSPGESGAFSGGQSFQPLPECVKYRALLLEASGFSVIRRQIL